MIKRENQALIFLILFSLNAFCGVISIENTSSSTYFAFKNCTISQGAHKYNHRVLPMSEQLIDHEPIQIYSNEDFITTATTEGWSGDGTQLSPITIYGLNITGSTNIPCVTIEGTDLWFQISNCFLNNKGIGFRFWNVKNGYIFNNAIHYNHLSLPNNEKWGITAGGEYQGANNIFANNTISNHEFPFEISQNNSLIVNNTIFTCVNGIFVTGNNNVIANNSVQDAGGGAGIWNKNAMNTTISHNFLHNNFEGITLENCNGGVITYNSIIETGYGINLHPNSKNNLITLNLFHLNNEGGISQAVDNGNNNIFTKNYWNDWVGPDIDGDGYVDANYMIDGLANNNDSFPLTSIDQVRTLHMLSIPIIRRPTEGSLLNKTTVIQWNATIDSKGHSVTYNISFSLDEGENWNILASRLNTTSYTWNTSTLPSNTHVLIKVIASCSEGCLLSNTIQVFTKDNLLIGSESLLMLLAVLGGLTIVGALAYYTYNSRSFHPRSFTDYFQSDKIEILKPIYEKLVLGLNNVQLGMIYEPISVPPIESAKPADLAEYFPSSFRNDLLSGLKGRTVLTLIEIAYQAEDVTNPSNLARILDMPLSSVSDEIKKLINLGYLEYHLSPKILKDGRYRNYIITGKGVSFLRILKGAIELTINRLKEKEHEFIV